MRVLHVTSGNLFGGIESMLLTLARHRDSCPAMEPHFAVTFEGRFSSELSAAGVPVALLGGVRASRPLTVVRARRKLRTLLNRVQFDAVICHSPWPHAIFGAAVRKAGIPLVFWSHSPVDRRHWTQRWAALTPPDFAICNSRYTAGSLALLFPSCRHAVIHCPVAAPASRASDGGNGLFRQELSTAPEAVVVLQVSRLEAWKGQRALLEALSLLRHRTEWICWMVGYPQTEAERVYLAQLRADAQSLGIADRVRFHEPRHGVGSAYDAADVFCQPNAGPEPFGIVFVEAMLSGLPVVTTAMGGPCEFVDQSCGVLVPPADAPALANALDQLIGDVTLRKTLGDSGLRRAHEFDPSVQLPRLAAILDGATRDGLNPEGAQSLHVKHTEAAR